MISQRQIAANRRNAGKSTGPKTQRGKKRVTCNAVSHGLASLSWDEAGSGQVERLATAICKGRTDPLLYEQAFIIAETQILLGRIRAARVAAIERARALPKSEPSLIPGFPTREQRQSKILEYLEREELRKVAQILRQMTAAIKAAQKRVAAGLPIFPGCSGCRSRWPRDGRAGAWRTRLLSSRAT
jgi:hypothetical protein